MSITKLGLLSWNSSMKEYQKGSYVSWDTKLTELKQIMIFSSLSTLKTKSNAIFAINGVLASLQQKWNKKYIKWASDHFLSKFDRSVVVNLKLDLLISHFFGVYTTFRKYCSLLKSWQIFER